MSHVLVVNRLYLKVDFMLNVRDLIGVPFKDKGRDINSGLDCWGLAQVIFARYDIILPDYLISCHDSNAFNTLAEQSRPQWIKLDTPQEPCIIAIKFNTNVINHVGVYIGDNKFMHTREKTGALIEDVNSIMWRRKIEGYYVPCTITEGVAKV